MKVVIYSTSTCAACETLTRWLESKGVTYERKITDEDPNCMEEFMSLNDGMIGVPFSVITDDADKMIKISGFDKSKFLQALHIS